MTNVAAIDCGTNSIRLLISDLSGERPRDLVRIMEIVRLGEGLDETGRIGEPALERTAAALRDFTALIETHQPKAVRMVATSASRDAENADEFRTMVRGILGVTPEVITGDEEARLSFGGAVADLPSATEPRLVVDIGGGSTEFVLGLDTADAARSVDIGCVRMTERHLRSDPPTVEEIRAAQEDIASHVADGYAAVDPDRSATTLIGLAGSVTTVAALALGLDEYRSDRIHHARVSRADVDAITSELLAETRVLRLRHGVMHPGRADVIAAGALVLRTIMEQGGFDEVVASEHDILDGIAASIA
ncbi:exopolyphosphatase [Stackebrandtia soli]|uniref:Ppx/GppA phosphatase family protein n=1 Tax=Stackebrandtia soli TaxID=1892856 RepID=UPI0039EB815A